MQKKLDNRNLLKGKFLGQLKKFPGKIREIFKKL